MSIFDAYDDEFAALARDVSAKISHANLYEDSHEKKLTELQKAEGALQQAADLIKQMEVEVRSEEDQSTRRDMNDKVGEFKKTLAGLRRDYNEMKAQEEHAALIEDPALEQRNRLMSANSRLERGSDRIKYALEITAETENTALEINDELNRNREKIEGVHSRVNAVSNLADAARRTIRGMSRREIQQKIALWAVALLLMAVVGSIIYLAVNGGWYGGGGRRRGGRY